MVNEALDEEPHAPGALAGGLFGPTGNLPIVLAQSPTRVDCIADISPLGEPRVDRLKTIAAVEEDW